MLHVCILLHSSQHTKTFNNSLLYYTIHDVSWCILHSHFGEKLYSGCSHKKKVELHYWHNNILKFQDLWLPAQHLQGTAHWIQQRYEGSNSKISEISKLKAYMPYGNVLDIFEVGNHKVKNNFLTPRQTAPVLMVPQNCIV